MWDTDVVLVNACETQPVAVHIGHESSSVRQTGPVPENNLQLEPMDGEEFLLLLRRQGRSEEAGGINSQYAKQLASGDPNFGAFSLVTCGTRIAAISYGLHEEPRGGISARLDTVVVHKGVRNGGLGGLMMAQLFDWMVKELGDELHHITTIAIHPAVAHFVSSLGFVDSPDDLPRYRLDLEVPEQREQLLAATQEHLRGRLQTLKTRCLTCQHKSWGTPWCRPA